MADTTLTPLAAIDGVSRTSRFAVVGVLVAASVVAALLLHREMQPAFYDPAGATLLAVVAALSLPFLLLPALMPMRARATRVAWILCMIMAIDSAVITLSVAGVSTGGHPPLEAVVWIVFGVAKLALVPLTAALLAFGWLKGERFALIGAGFVCLVAETALTFGRA